MGHAHAESALETVRGDYYPNTIIHQILHKTYRIMLPGMQSMQKTRRIDEGLFEDIARPITGTTHIANSPLLLLNKRLLAAVHDCDLSHGNGQDAGEQLCSALG